DLCDCRLDAANGHCTSGTLDHASHYFKSDSVYPPPLDGRKLAETSWGGLFDPADKVVAAAFHGPTSPFTDGWNIVHVPYTTVDGGDLGRQRRRHRHRLQPQPGGGHLAARGDLRDEQRRRAGERALHAIVVGRGDHSGHRRTSGRGAAISHLPDDAARRGD